MHRSVGLAIWGLYGRAGGWLGVVVLLAHEVELPFKTLPHHLSQVHTGLRISSTLLTKQETTLSLSLTAQSRQGHVNI